MPQKCKAIVYRECGKLLTIEEVSVSSPRQNEVMVKISACGVCHSDLSIINGSIPLPPPLVVGHEASGVVAQVGEGVTDIAIGDHVVLTWSANCGKCQYCQHGKPQLCDESDKRHVSRSDGTFTIQDASGKPIGSFAGIGTMSEYVTVPRESVVKIDRAISLESAALIGCAVMTGVGAVINTAKVEEGSTVAIFGIGGVGIAVIQGAVLAKASKIMAISGSDSHLELAKKFGATHFFNTKTDGDLLAAIQKLVPGGVDYAFECAGQPVMIQQAFECVHKGGKAIVVGLTKMTDTVTLPSFVITLSEKVLTGSNYGSAKPNEDFPKLLALYQQGSLKLDEMITHRYRMDEVNQAFADMAAGKNIRGVIVF